MFRRFLNLFRPNRLEAEIREELEFHRAQTSGSFGNMTRIREQTRAASTVVWLETLVQDLRYGLRQLRKAPVLSAVAVLSLALGIGANTAIFSLVDAVLLRWLPVAHPEQLSLLVKKDRRNNRGNFSFPFAQLLRSEAKSFSAALLTSQPGRSKISLNNGLEQTVTTEDVSANYFAVLGLNPSAGRFFATGEDEPGAPDYAVISHGYWQRHFARDPGAIGKTIEKSGNPVTIIGVAPPEFFGISAGSSIDIWATFARVPKKFINPGMNFLQILGRRRPGVSEQAAQAEADALLQHHLLEYTSQGRGWTAREKALVLSGRIVLEPGATGLSSLRLQFSKPFSFCSQSRRSFF
jgi:hypothetical protein